MLTTIREKAQGAFAWFILIAICVPFALWGIQNYLDTSQEAPVASVGSKDFYQRDVNKAYEQYSQNLAGLGIDEQVLKAQALDKLIKDEVLLQYANQQRLTATDSNVREFIKSLPYFQTEGKFDDKKFKSLLASQRMSSSDFVNKIKSALIMEQLQRSITDSAFATKHNIDNFFKIQNQQREVNYVTLPLEKVTALPTDKEIADYYQQHQDQFKIPEQASLEYLELSLDEIAKKVEVTDDKLRAFYEEQKEQYTTPERRKISHILFAVNSQTDDKAALAKAQKAGQDLKTQDFATLAAQVSDDKLTAKKGGDLGLLTGGMEKPFEEAASKLTLNEVSQPVKTSFGYHLIKVTELTPSETKPFDAVKPELAKNYQKAQAENKFYESGEKLATLSYENPDSLQTAAQKLSLEVKKTGLFDRTKGEGIAAEQKVRDAAFSEEVIKDNNSTPIELSPERIAVIRILEHKPSSVRDLKEVKAEVSAAILNERARQQVIDKANALKKRLQAGEALQKIAEEVKLELKSANATRNANALPAELSDAVFSAAKPAGNKPSVFIVPLNSGEQAVVSLNKVTPGVMSEEDKKKMDLAQKNLAQAFGQADFNSMIGTLQANADIDIRNQPKQQ